MRLIHGASHQNVHALLLTVRLFCWELILSSKYNLTEMNGIKKRKYFFQSLCVERREIMKRIMLISATILFFAIFNLQAFGGTAVKINNAKVNLSYPDTPILILNGSNFDIGISYIGIGGFSLSDCKINPTLIECPLTGIPLSMGTWTVNISAGNSPAKNDEIDVFFPVGLTAQCNGGDIVECYTGDPATLGVGICESGYRDCLPVGTWSECQGEVLPQIEICDDGIDNDCDTELDCADSDCSSDPACQCTDSDGDGYGTGPGCTGEIDCDDYDSSVNPGAEEICDGKDNDCDGAVDEGCIDYDNDGYYSSVDCNDYDPSVNPGAEEICGDYIDNDCDGSIDEGCPLP